MCASDEFSCVSAYVYTPYRQYTLQPNEKIFFKGINNY